MDVKHQKNLIKYSLIAAESEPVGSNLHNLFMNQANRLKAALDAYLNSQGESECSNVQAAESKRKQVKAKSKSSSKSAKKPTKTKSAQEGKSKSKKARDTK